MGIDNSLFAPIDEDVDDPKQKTPEMTVGDIEIGVEHETPDRADPEPTEDPILADEEPPAKEDDGEIQAEDDDENLNLYSRAARKRIMRERRLRQEDSSAYQATLARMAQIANKALDEQHKMNRASQAMALKHADNEISRIKSELAAAGEANDHAKVAELQSQLAEAHGTKNRVVDWGNSIPEKPPVVGQDNTISITREKNIAAWRAANGWFEDPRYAREAEYVNKVIAAELDGSMDSTQPSYWRELNSRIRKNVPRLANVVRDVRFPGQQQDTSTRAQPAQRRPASPASASSATPGRSQQQATRRFVLTATERQNMISVGMDPNNKDHIREWAQNALEIRGRK